MRPQHEHPAAATRTLTFSECDEAILVAELLDQNQGQPVPAYTGKLTSSSSALAQDAKCTRPHRTPA